MSNTQNRDFDDQTRQGRRNTATEQGDYETRGRGGSGHYPLRGQQGTGYDDPTSNAGLAGSGTGGLDDSGGQRTYFGGGGADPTSDVSGGDYGAPSDFSSAPGGDQYQSGAGTGRQYSSGADTGQYSSGAGTGQYSSGTGTGQYSSGAGAGRDDDFDSYDDPQRQRQQHGQKPGMGDRVMGGIEKAAGKIMKDPDMEARGQERKTGSQF